MVQRALDQRSDVLEDALQRDVRVLPSGLQYTDLRVGEGQLPAAGDAVVAHVKGFLPNGFVFEDTRLAARPLVLSAGVRPPGVPEGLEEGLLSMRAGGVRLLAVPASLGFGRVALGSLGIVPPRSPLRYEVEALRCQEGASGLTCCSQPSFPCSTDLDRGVAEALRAGPGSALAPPTVDDMVGME